MRDSAPQGTYKVQALDRAFAVLDLLGESETPLGLAQVASSLLDDRLPAIWGRATLTIVVSRISMNAASVTATAISQGL